MKSNFNEFKIQLSNPEYLKSLKEKAKQIKIPEYKPMQPIGEEQQKAISEAIKNLRSIEVKK